MHKRRQEIKKILERVGIVDNFDLSMTNNGHFKIDSEHLKRQIITSGTPSDIRAAMNIYSEIRKNLVDGFIPVKNHYSKEEKQTLVNLCEVDKIHPQEVSEKYGVGFSTLKKWIFRDRENRGLSTINSQSVNLDNYPPYKAFIFDINQGLSIIEASKKHSIPVSRGYDWNAREKSKEAPNLSSGKVIKLSKSDKDKTNFIGAIDTLKQLVGELEQARDRIASLEQENDSYKAKFALLVEASTI